MSAEETIALIGAYYTAFNRQEPEAMLALLTDDVIHEPSQGDVRVGKPMFAEFLEHKNRCYGEEVLEPTIMATPNGEHAAAEFQVRGVYLATDEGRPEANGQTYGLRIGAFFEVRDGLIARISSHYNLEDWISQIDVAVEQPAEG